MSGALAAPPDPPSRAYWWVVSLCVGAAGCWLAWRTSRISKSAVERIVFGAVGVGLVVAAVVGGIRLTDRGPVDWIHYTPERLAAARAAGSVVVLEFTAEWCLNCKGLEEGVLRQADVVAFLNSDGVAPIKVDLTGNNAEGNAQLQRTGRLAIPLLVIYAPDGREIFKGDFYTAQQVLDAARRARELGKE